MTDFYVIDDHVVGHEPQAYVYPELIKVLNNQQYRWLFDYGTLFSDWLTLYCGVTQAKYIPAAWGGFTLQIQAEHRQAIQGARLDRVVLAAQRWLQDVKEHEPWDGYTNYLVQSDRLGQPVDIPRVLTSPGRYGRRTMRHIAHSFQGYKHGRVGHTMSANARHNYWKRALAKELAGYPLTHRNRKDRHHEFRLPVFDDPEYCTAKHSTGWKHSTKRRHQYEAKINHEKAHPQTG